jgi:integrase
MPDTQYRLAKPVINGQRSEYWYAVWREGGRSYRASSGQRDKTAAEEWLAQFKEDRAAPLGPWTIGRVYSGYLEAIGPKQAHVSRKSLMADFQHLRPESLKQSHIDAYIKRRADSVAEATYATELRYLRAALNWAHREGHIDAPRPFRVPAGRTVRYRFYTQEEFDTLIANADTLCLRLFMEIAIATASRPAKIYQLKWSDVKTNPNFLAFKAGNRTKRTRPVPINYRLSWALGVAYQARQSEYVIERNGKPVKSLAKQFRELTRSVGIKDATLRDFRGTVASWALQRGAPIEKVADLLNDSVEVVERHYGHFSPAHIQSVTDLLG